MKQLTILQLNNDKKFIDGVRDLRINELKLSSTNGVISIYTEPFGELLDSVAYSKNRNDSLKNHRNFGLKKVVERIDMLHEEAGWVGTEDCIFPNDTVMIEKSTTTRSLNRAKFLDSNSCEDWYLVPTGKYTFGFKNNIERYQPFFKSVNLKLKTI